jgi:hypothetical protein
MSGGDIKNAVIKAAAAAAAEPGSDLGKRITQAHFDAGAQDVLSAKSIMQQSLFTDEGVAAADPVNLWQMVETRWRAVILVTLALAGTAFITAIVALAILILR